MSREIVFRPVARLEFDEAVAWYEGERPGLGMEFKAAADHTLIVAAGQPELFRKTRGPARRAVLRRFPYAPYFIAEPARLTMLAVFHTARDPIHLRSR